MIAMIIDNGMIIINRIKSANNMNNVMIIYSTQTIDDNTVTNDIRVANEMHSS